MIELLGKLTISKEQQQVYVGIPGTLFGPRSKNKKKKILKSSYIFPKQRFSTTFLYFLKIYHIFQRELLKPEKQKKINSKEIYYISPK